MRLCNEPQADDAGGEAKEGLLNINESIEPAAKATEGVQPGIGSLNGPAGLSQAAAVFGVALGNDRRDPQPTQEGA